MKATLKMHKPTPTITSQMQERKKRKGEKKYFSNKAKCKQKKYILF